ncbi:glycosyltransferase family 2 protein [Sabulicella rubraurantiaca]|uniref:glycosyltransferase family 2 protein n=1 Tax=Sabulicella rubraurantiaca TaxID=2811429 RepID=UPI001A96A35A|nr:glycosyltransferase family 2 protein [Sabulicella rubraurantiaca]
MDVSVILPLRAGAASPSGMMRSIFGQRHEPREVIVVDDGATDEGLALKAEFGSRLAMLRVERSGGVQAMRNAGIAKARGDWLAFVDGSECWGPDFLLRLATLHRAAPKLDLLFTDFRQGEPAAATGFAAAPPGWWDGSRRQDLPEGWVFERPVAALAFRWTPIRLSASVFARSLVERVGGFDSRMRGLRPEAWEFLLRCLYAGRLGALPEALVAVRRGDTATPHDQAGRLIQEVELLRFVLRHHREAVPFRAVIEEEIRHRRVAAADLAFAERNHALARRLLSEVASRDRSLRLRAKAACLALPDRLGLPLNGLLQRLSEWRQRRAAA